MNVLHVIADMDPVKGGVCQAVRTIIIGLSKQGVYSEVVSLDSPKASFLSKETAKIHALGPGTGSWQYSSNLLPWLQNNLSRFDKILVHGLWLYPGYAVSKSLKQLRKDLPLAVPHLFVMPHGMLDPYFQKAEGRRWKALRNVLYWNAIESKLIHQAEALLFTCETERLLAHEPFTSYRPRREFVVSLGVEAAPICSSNMRVAFLAKCRGLQLRPYLLFLSRIHEKKGVELLIQAYAQTYNDFAAAVVPDTAKVSSTDDSSGKTPAFPALVIAGPGLDTDYGQRMYQLAADLTAPGAVFFPGMLTGDAKWGAFYGCEAFVLPSHQENFGIAVIEAMACQQAVLISNQVNIWREIKSTGSGMVASDTLQGTKYLLESWSRLTDTEKATMRKNSYSTYHELFDVSLASTRMRAALQ